MKSKFAKFSEVEVGDILVADGGFTCIKEGAEQVVKKDVQFGLYVPCDRGRHYMDGQLDHETGEVIGFSWAKERL